jgi:hypothetical protein
MIVSSLPRLFCGLEFGPRTSKKHYKEKSRKLQEPKKGVVVVKKKERFFFGV